MFRGFVLLRGLFLKGEPMENEEVKIKQLEVVMTLNDVFKLIDILEDDFILSVELEAGGSDE